MFIAGLKGSGDHLRHTQPQLRAAGLTDPEVHPAAAASGKALCLLTGQRCGGQAKECFSVTAAGFSDETHEISHD